MIRVHRREGGSWLSVIVAKYFIRTLIAPFWQLRLKWKLPVTPEVSHFPALLADSTFFLPAV